MTKYELIKRDVLQDALNKILELIYIQRTTTSSRYTGDKELVEQLSEIHDMIQENRVPCNVRPEGDTYSTKGMIQFTEQERELIKKRISDLEDAILRAHTDIPFDENYVSDILSKSVES